MIIVRNVKINKSVQSVSIIRCWVCVTPVRRQYFSWLPCIKSVNPTEFKKSQASIPISYINIFVQNLIKLFFGYTYYIFSIILFESFLSSRHINFKSNYVLPIPVEI